MHSLQSFQYREFACRNRCQRNNRHQPEKFSKAHFRAEIKQAEKWHKHTAHHCAKCGCKQAPQPYGSHHPASVLLFLTLRQIAHGTHRNAEICRVAYQFHSRVIKGNQTQTYRTEQHCHNLVAHEGGKNIQSLHSPEIAGVFHYLTILSVRVFLQNECPFLLTILQNYNFIPFPNE